MGLKQYRTIFISLTVLYISSVLFFPVEPMAIQRYNLTELNVRLLGLAIVIPAIVIWFVALYASLWFKDYALLIKRTKEGKAFAKLANGLTVLALSLPLNAVSSNLLNYLSQLNTDLEPVTTIIKNYIALLFQLVAFLLIAKGAGGLLNTLKPKRHFHHTNFFIFGVVACTALFTWLASTNPLSVRTESSYYLPTMLIILTIIVPYIFVWYQGVVATRILFMYKTHVQGAIYSQMTKWLAQGFSVIIVLSILIQLLITVSEKLNKLNITPILLLIYGLLLLSAVGYGLVARGAKQLKKIEEV